MQNDYPPSAVALFIVAAVFTALPTVAVALRIAGRRIKRVALWYDDYMMMASLFVMYSFMILMVLSVTDGETGRPSRTIPPQNLVFLMKVFLAIQFLWVTGITLAKLGILLFYLRIFRLRRDRIAAQAVVGVTACWWLAGFVSFFFTCQPFSYNWNSNQEGNCDARLSLWVSVAAAHMMIEIIILLLPLPMVWKLQLPLRRKLGLSVLFALGIFVCIISAIRIYILQSSSHSDLIGSLPISHIWSFLEPTIAICTSCLPMTRPFFSKYLPTFLHRSKSSKISEHQLLQYSA